MPGLPTVLPSSLSSQQMDAYVLMLRIDELGRRIKSGDVLPPGPRRSPSPPPLYGPDGKRLNTREWRYRKRVEDERHALVQRAAADVPDYRPPADYRRPTKLQDKIYIPVKDYPEINFIGLLIGPRGNTLKKMEGESGAKISIRGKGSVKEGKQVANPQAGDAEDLHCLVSGDTELKVQKAIKLIEKIIETVSTCISPFFFFLAKAWPMPIACIPSCSLSSLLLAKLVLFVLLPGICSLIFVLFYRVLRCLNRPCLDI